MAADKTVSAQEKQRRIIEAVLKERARRAKVTARKADCQNDLMEFVRVFWPIVEPSIPLVEGWVLEAIVDMLMAAADGHQNRVIINVPPGTAKSSMLNVFFPAWVWGPKNRPAARFLSASYSTTIPERDNYRLLRILKSKEYQAMWGDRVKIAREGMQVIETEQTGWKRVISTGSGTTGHRADFLLLDDLNDPNTVESDSVRHSTNHWIREVMPDRLNNLQKSVIINIQQRTHELDATGVLASYGYTSMVIPMEFDPDRFQPIVLRRDKAGNPTKIWADPRGLDQNGLELPGRAIGINGKIHCLPGSPIEDRRNELCWPERFSFEAVQKMKEIKGPYAWAAQYSQLPTVRGGAILRREWWQNWRHEDLPEFGTVVASLDTAIKEGEDNDYNAITAWGAFPGATGAPNFMLCGAERIRTSLAELVRWVAAFCRAHKVDYLLIEDKMRGHDVAAEVVRQYATAPWETILLRIKGTRHDAGKVDRVRAISPMFSGPVRRDPATGIDVWEGGIIWAPATDWAEEVINEATSFPRGQHDDYVDSMSQALAYLRRTGVLLTKQEYDDAAEEAMRYRPPIGVPYAIPDPKGQASITV